jgi:hypothetical protein
MYGLRKNMRDEARGILRDLSRFRDRIEAKAHVLKPRVRWRG